MQTGLNGEQRTQPISSTTPIQPTLAPTSTSAPPTPSLKRKKLARQGRVASGNESPAVASLSKRPKIASSDPVFTAPSPFSFPALAAAGLDSEPGTPRFSRESSIGAAVLGTPYDTRPQTPTTPPDLSAMVDDMPREGPKEKARPSATFLAPVSAEFVMTDSEDEREEYQDEHENQSISTGFSVGVSVAASVGSVGVSTAPAEAEAGEDDTALEEAAVAAEEYGDEEADGESEVQEGAATVPPTQLVTLSQAGIDVTKEQSVERDGVPVLAPRRGKNRGSHTHLDVDELRVKLNDQEAINEFLASKWIDIKELQRLESLGLFTYRRGKFTEAERSAMRNHLDTFQKGHDLNDEQLLEIIMCKGRKAERRNYPKFWPELAAQLPGRPVRYVKEAVKRMYDPRARKGAWTAAEDGALMRAYAEYPNQWSKICVIVDRTEIDCRDRWKGELRDRDSRKIGPWDADETQKLVTAVHTANEGHGLEPDSKDTPWDVVVRLMGGTRTRTQCRKKWQDCLEHGTRTSSPLGGAKEPFIPRQRLVARLRELGYAHEADIEWAKVPDVAGGLDFKASSLRSTWHKIKGLAASASPMSESVSASESLTVTGSGSRSRSVSRSRSRSRSVSASAPASAPASESAATPTPPPTSDRSKSKQSTPFPEVLDLVDAALRDKERREKQGDRGRWLAKRKLQAALNPRITLMSVAEEAALIAREVHDAREDLEARLGGVPEVPVLRISPPTPSAAIAAAAAARGSGAAGR